MLRSLATKTGFVKESSGDSLPEGRVAGIAVGTGFVGQQHQAEEEERKRKERKARSMLHGGEDISVKGSTKDPTPPAFGKMDNPDFGQGHPSSFIHSSLCSVRQAFSMS